MPNEYIHVTTLPDWQSHYGQVKMAPNFHKKCIPLYTFLLCVRYMTNVMVLGSDIKIPHSRMKRNMLGNIDNRFAKCMQQVTKGHLYHLLSDYYNLIPTGSEEREISGFGSIPFAILPSCQDIKAVAMYLHKHEYSWVITMRNTSEAVLRPQYTPWPSY